ncbi:hypothetical protein Bca52824_009836 [Brassica carinata]|uniref:Uncharacterized protein n=1 Tax=Brassica carinata TaxID=52824 RepID=A0A8X7WAH2_BRACI|nr:hypothetical protein Bca52824_009836 [Brassica carinata]
MDLTSKATLLRFSEEATDVERKLLVVLGVSPSSVVQSFERHIPVPCHCLAMGLWLRLEVLIDLFILDGFGAVGGCTEVMERFLHGLCSMPFSYSISA